MKIKIIFAALAVATSANAKSADLKPCGERGDFKTGKIDCAAVNGTDSESGGWNLVKRAGNKSWWLDSETGTVWGPTHAIAGMAYSFDGAEQSCIKENGSLPTLEEYFYAFTWRYAHMVVMNNSVDSTIRVFWAKSRTFKNKNWWVSFDKNGNLEKTPLPLSSSYPADFRCVWRE
jgi:hypothetical protein